MSRGFGGWGYITDQDKNTVIYQYGTYNLNNPQYENEMHLSDGMFIIDKNSLIEPDIHTKIKHFSNGKRKLITKRIIADVPYSELYENGKIQIQDCSNCWKTFSDGKDFIAWHLIWKVFKRYQENGLLPEKISYEV